MPSFRQDWKTGEKKKKGSMRSHVNELVMIKD